MPAFSHLPAGLGGDTVPGPVGGGKEEEEEDEGLGEPPEAKQVKHLITGHHNNSSLPTYSFWPCCMANATTFAQPCLYVEMSKY